MKRLLAYEVREPDEGHCVIVFATNNATARREGGNELDCEFGEVEHCRRRPHFDQYAPGPVPPLVLIEHGWWFECHHCSRKIDEYMDDENFDPDDCTPVASGQDVFCCSTCQARNHAERRANGAAKVALIELFEAKFPGCSIKDVHVYGAKLEPRDDGGGMKCTVSFLFPGARYGATYEYGSPELYIAQGDLPAYYTWRGIEPPAEASWPT